MNRKYFMFLLILITVVAGCKKNELQYFNEDVPLMNIWFGEANTIRDSLVHNFAFSIAEKDSIQFNYRIAGFPSDVDRPFELEIVSGDKDLIGVTLGTYVVPAGAYEGKAVFHVQRPGPSGLPVFDTRDPKLVLRVKPSQHFQPSPRETSSLNITFKNRVTKPENWDQATYPYRTLATYFGAYSDVKYSFIIQTTGLSNFQVYFTMAAQIPDLPPNTITSSHADFLKSQCKIALAQYQLENGGPLLDENNNPVVFP